MKSVRKSSATFMFQVQGTLWLDEIDKLEGTIEEKLDVAVTAIECPTEYLQLFEELIKVIEMQLQKRFRKSRVKAYGFGSFLTGLALKNCDLDLYVEFGNDKSIR